VQNIYMEVELDALGRYYKGPPQRVTFSDINETGIPAGNSDFSPSANGPGLEISSREDNVASVAANRVEEEEFKAKSTNDKTLTSSVLTSSAPSGIAVNEKNQKEMLNAAKKITNLEDNEDILKDLKEQQIRALNDFDWEKHGAELNPLSSAAAPQNTAAEQPNPQSKTISPQDRLIVIVKSFFGIASKKMIGEEELGRGAYGAVFPYGNNQVMKQPVSTEGIKEIKADEETLKEEKIGDEKALKNEKKILDYLNFGALGHTGVQARQKIRWLRDGKITQTVVITKKYSKGDLNKHLINNPEMKIKQRSEIGYDLMKGHLFIRSKHILHLDIKKENCLVGEKRAVIGDFGGAVKEKDLLKGKPVSGTYMPPVIYYSIEQLQDNAKIKREGKGTINESRIAERYKGKNGIITAGRDADVFAMGVTLYCLFTNSKPPKGSALVKNDKINSIDVKVDSNEVKKVLKDEKSLAPPDLADLIHKMICDYASITNDDLLEVQDVLKKLSLS